MLNINVKGQSNAGIFSVARVPQERSDKASGDNITPVEAEQPEEGWCCCNYWRLVLLSVSS